MFWLRGVAPDDYIVKATLGMMASDPKEAKIVKGQTTTVGLALKQPPMPPPGGGG